MRRIAGSLDRIAGSLDQRMRTLQLPHSKYSFRSKRIDASHDERVRSRLAIDARRHVAARLVLHTYSTVRVRSLQRFGLHFPRYRVLPG